MKHREFTAHVGNQVNIIQRHTNHASVYHIFHMSNMHGNLNRVVSRVHSMRFGSSEMPHHTVYYVCPTYMVD